jgi:hypothetical protein
MAPLDSILGSYSIPGTDLSPHDPSKKYRARLLNVYVPAICPVFFFLLSHKKRFTVNYKYCTVYILKGVNVYTVYEFNK